MAQHATITVGQGFAKEGGKLWRYYQLTGMLHVTGCNGKNNPDCLRCKKDARNDRKRPN